jgi:hypothetical protein
MNREQTFIRSPWGFNNNSRGCSEAEPVVTSRPHTPNPAGVEQPSQNKAGGIYSTPTGSVKTTPSANHGFRFTPPAAIIVMTPMGSEAKGDVA